MTVTPLPPEVLYLIKLYVASLAALVAYAFLTNRLRKATLPLRCAFAYQAEKLLSEKCLPREKEITLEFLLDHALDGRLPWMIVIVLPIATAARSLGFIKPEQKISSRASQNKFGITALLGLVSVVCLSPMAALIMIIEIFILIIVTRPGRILSSVVTLLIPINRFLDAHSPHRSIAP
jgi:hypothetical protein